jgi:hypothetical protein
MPNWFEKTDIEIINRLKNVLRTDDFQFIGKYEPVAQKDFGFFKDVRSLSGVRKFYPKDDGSTDENKIRPLEIYTKAYDKLIADKWYKFYAVPAATPLRKSKKNPFLLQTDWKRVKDIISLKGEELIESIKNDALNTPEGIAGNLMRAIETISIDINTEPTTFIFELIQNADDYPNSEKNVSITFQIDNSNLIIKHNGSNFEVNNTVALCGVNEGDKRESTNKIGFKGIGFKSIFKDSNFAYIKSGDFSFRFDEEFWRQQGIEIFWHITPINTPVNDFKHLLKSESNVNILIKPRALQALKTYKETFINHFNDERILLFLRNVKSLIFDSPEMKFQISNSSSKWKIFTENNVEIPQNETDELNRRINFPDKRIPVKFYDITLTELGFGFRIDQNKIESINDGSIYAYLPTKVNLGFSFILNGNFIPDASRTKIYADLTWNSFLLEKAGELFIKQLISLLDEGYEIESVLKQIPSFPEILLNVKEDDKIIFINCFKKGFEKELINQQFIPTQIGILDTLSNILIDETGISDLLKDEFHTLTGTSGNLINKNAGDGIEKIKELINEYNQDKIYGIDNLKDNLKSPIFQEWLKVPTNNYKLIEYFNSNEGLKSLLKSEEIILSESNLLLKASSLYSSIADEVTFLPIEKINNELSTLLNDNKITLSLTAFEPVQFFKEFILKDIKKTNDSLSNETNLLNFWRFVFDNWTLFENEKIIKDSLQLFEVLCKPKSENELSKKVISLAYLSAQFNTTNEIESVVKDISPDAVFISEKYIDKIRGVEKWRKIFKLSTAITDLQKVIEVLITKLSSIEDLKHFEITKQIFKYWKENKDTDYKLTAVQIGLIKSNLKIKRSDKEFKKSTECFISDHYNNNQNITSLIPEIELSSQIVSDYGNQIMEWKEFFKLLDCAELSDNQSILDAKINFLNGNQLELSSKHFEILKSISELHKNRNENGLEFDFENVLSKVKLKTTKNDFQFPKSIHLSNKYNPKLNLENDEIIREKIFFLSSEYLEKNISTKFILRIGVNENFKFEQVINRIQIENFLDKTYLSLFFSMKSYIDRYAVISKNYTTQDLLKVTSIRNHVTLNYEFIFNSPKYLPFFWEYILKDKYALNKLSLKTELRIWDNNIYQNENYVLYKLKRNDTILAGEVYKKPTELYSKKLIPYLVNNEEYPVIDFSNIYVDEEKNTNLELLLGIKQKLSPDHCLSILSKKEISLTENEINELDVVSILSTITPKREEIIDLKFPNKLYQWKPINELFISSNNDFQIEQSQELHEAFSLIAQNFGIQELTENNLVLKTNPDNPEVLKEIIDFFRINAKFIAFKIDNANYQDVETKIIETIDLLNFYEVTSISKVFPETNPIFQTELDFYLDNDESKILYKGNWKTNEKIKDFLLKQVLSEKIPAQWFENVILRWDETTIIERLKDDFGDAVPFEPEIRGLDSNQQLESLVSEIDNDEMSEFEQPFKDISEDDELFIRGIIKGDYDLNNMNDINTTAKIKTLLFIRSKYIDKTIEDKEYFLKAGEDEIVVRSAQNGLLFLNLYHWNHLKNDEVKLAVYTNHEIKIFESQEELIDFTKNQNKFGILRMPGNYNLEHYNTLNNIEDKGKWHFVFIVNENTKTVDSYKSVFEKDDLYENYNF